MKLSVLFDQGIINHSDLFKVFICDDILGIVPVRALIPSYMDLPVSRLLVRNSELHIYLGGQF